MAPPPDDYGWAYIDAQRATASAGGPSGSLQFRWGSEDLVPGQFSGSEDLVFYAATDGHKSAPDASGSALYLYGNMYISGAVHAETYTIRQVTSTEVQVSGSTQFGDTSDDAHQRTGSMGISKDLTLRGDLYLESDSPSRFGKIVASHADSDTYIQFNQDEINTHVGGVQFYYSAEAGGGGIHRFNPSNADIDFQVSTQASSGSLKIDGETGDIHMGGDKFVFDHSEGILSIRPGTSDQGQLILASRDGTSADDALLTFRRYTDGTLADGDNLGVVQWKGAEDEDGTYYTAAAIMAEVDEAAWTDGSSAAGRLLFFTTPDGSTTAAERMRITNAGKVGIGSTAPEDQPDEKNDLVIGDLTGNRGMTIASTATGVGTIRFAGNTNANDGEGWIDYSGNTKKLRIGTDGLNTRMVVDSVGTQVTGTLEVSSNTIIGGDLIVDSFIRHNADGEVPSDTYIAMAPDQMTFRAGSTNMLRIYGSDASGSQNSIALNNSSNADDDGTTNDTDFYMLDGHYNAGGTPKYHFFLRGNDPQVATNGSLHITASLGPITGSGEIHAAKFVGNDMWISGAAAHGTGPVLAVGTTATVKGASVGNSIATIDASGSSHALYIAGGMSASHDIKAEHLYVNDLYISGTAHGIVVDRSNYASSSVTTNRTYSPVGFDTSGYLYVSGSSILGSAAAETHQVTGSLEVSSNAIISGEIHAANYIRHLDDGEQGHSDTYIHLANDAIQFRAGSNNMMTMTSYDGSGSHNVISFNAGTNAPDTDMVMYSTDVGQFAFHVRVKDDYISHPQVNSSMHISAALGPVTGSGEVHVAKVVANDIETSGSLTVGTTFAMPDNTAAKILVADGTSYQEVAVSGDVTISSAGAVTIAAAAVENGMVNENVIGSATNIGSNTLAQADELLVYDADASAGARLKAITFSNLEDAVFANVSGDATIASGGALTIAATAVENSMLAGSIEDSKLNTISTAGKVALSALDIDGGNDIGAPLVDADLIIVDDGANGTNRKVEMSRIKTYTKTDVGTAGTVEADKAIIVSNAASITGGLTSVTGSGDLYFKDVKATSNLISDGGLLASGSSVVGSLSGHTHQVTGSFEAQSISGSGNFSAKGTAHIGDTLTMDGAGIVFNVANSAGTVDLSVNDGAGADVAITLGKNGKVTKIGDDTPSDGQYLSWDALGGKVAWSDGTTPDMSGSDPHYSSTELRTSGDLKVSGSVTLGAGATLSGSAAGPGSYLVLDTNNNIKIDTAASTYTNDGAYIEWGADAEIKLQHIPDAGLRIENLNNGDNQQAILILKGGDGAVQNNDPIGALHFMGSDSGGGDSANLLASVEASASFTHASDRNDTTLVFKTAGQDAPEAVRAIMIDEEQTLRGYESAGTTEGWNITPSGSATFADLAIKGNIVHVADTDTAIKFTPNTMSLHAGNNTQPLLELSQNSVVFNEGSNSADFRIESNGKQNAFFIDGADGNEQVLIVDGYDNGGISIAKSGSLLVGSWAHFDGDVTIIGDLTVAGNDIKSNTGNTVLSFDNNGYIDNDVVIESNTAKLSLASKTGETVLALYGPGGAISNGGNIGSVRFYGTETDGIDGNPAQTAYILVEGDEASWTYNSSLGTMMKFAVGVDGSTTLDEILYITGISGEARVGIGTDAPDSLLDVTVNDSSEYVARFRQQNSSGYGIRVRNADDSAGKMITFSNDGGTNAGHITMDGTTVTYGAFTAYHPALLPEADNDTGYDYGTLVKITSVDSTTHAKSVLYNVEKTTTAQDKAVLGVYSTALGTSQNDDGSADMESDRHSIFAVGDGHILVCSEGGNIETGDYICSSNTAGHGMKQSDDILRNYTVARASEPVDWSTEGSSTKLIACTYHAG